MSTKEPPDRWWQVRLTLDVDGDGNPRASVETSRLNGRSHTWQGYVAPGAIWTFTDLDAREGWPGKLTVQLEPTEQALDHDEHTPS